MKYYIALTSSKGAVFEVARDTETEEAVEAYRSIAYMFATGRINIYHNLENIDENRLSRDTDSSGILCLSIR
jgi:hypothetical protein